MKQDLKFVRRRSRRAGLGARWAVAIVAMAVFAAACGSSGDAGGGGDDGGDRTPGEAGTPAKLAFLWEIPGDSANAIPDYDEGARLAVEEINAAGGVLGMPLDYERFPVPIGDPQGARTELLKAVEAEPSGIVGIPFGAPAYARDLTAVKIPNIQASTEPQLARGAEAGGDYIFIQEPFSGESAAFSVQFAQDSLGARRVGILSTDDNFGRSNSEAAKEAIDRLGLELVSEQYVPTSTTDVTSQLLAMGDIDVLLTYEFPNVQALTVRQLAENGIDTPVVGTSGPQLVVYADLVPDSALGNLYGINPCSPSPESEREPARAFADAYLAKYGRVPSAKAALTHDSVHLLALAMEAANTTTDHAAIRDALAELRWDGGACQSEYWADGAHFLSHEQVATRFLADGTTSDVAVFDLAPLEEGDV